jgi:DNA-binding response OmpR family regulator
MVYNVIDMEITARKRILVVDDEPGIGKILRIKLNLCGYEVITTTSGAEAIDLVSQKKPDVVLLDILMPDVTGMDVLDRVRAFSQVPIIVFTGRPDIFQMAKKLGANDCISKPFDPDMLVEKINSILNGSQCVTKCNGDQANSAAGI